MAHHASNQESRPPSSKTRSTSVEQIRVMTRALPLIVAVHSDTPWTAFEHIDMDDGQLVDYAVTAGLMDHAAPETTGQGSGDSDRDGDVDGDGYGDGDGHGYGHGNGDGYGDGDGHGYGHGNGEGYGYGGNGQGDGYSYGNGDGNGDGDDGNGGGGGWSKCPYYDDGA